jgi:hypothetical protein
MKLVTLAGHGITALIARLFSGLKFSPAVATIPQAGFFRDLSQANPASIIFGVRVRAKHICQGGRSPGLRVSGLGREEGDVAWGRLGAGTGARGESDGPSLLCGGGGGAGAGAVVRGPG